MSREKRFGGPSGLFRALTAGESLHKVQFIGEAAAVSPWGKTGKSRRVGNHLKIFKNRIFKVIAK